MNIDGDKLLEFIKKTDSDAELLSTDTGGEDWAFFSGYRRALERVRNVINSGELAAKRVYARAPDEIPECSEFAKLGAVYYITPKKEYEVFESDSFADFRIIDDRGVNIGCNWKYCAHLNGANWERVEK